MCGRFALFSDMMTIIKYCDALTGKIMWHPCYNIPPGSDVPLIVKENNSQVLSLVRWGFLPHFRNGSKVITFNIINAKAETVAEKSVFKDAFENNRCLIPANGFYEWRSNDKQPYFFTLKDQQLFFFAGIRSGTIMQKKDVHVDTFAIITTTANDLVQRVHHRMPAILKEEHIGDWLFTKDVKKLQNMLNPYDSSAMSSIPVSREVNNTHNNYPQLINPLD